ncbi:sigma-54-dependent Fis family transcriptional regulator [Alloalcanivorax profundimaris]|uniref:sigma-54-dependent Fis family transcriptional regulator n=1 Tax=Alloalcanivorax profundimaris TaxID=2735259 RepID=UPI001887E106|nr:sigma-54-dependent Fis family transcriptional regulator [Alloalcanivorax profundimaris]MBF1801198.1 sigma-54-dependent Fis family transcriptional regulator [Alloalcanivorax profundimaris]
MPATGMQMDRQLLEARRLFEEGREVPPGWVRGEVIRSWQRSRAYGLDPGDRRLFSSVSRQALRHLHEYREQLLDYVAPEMDRLFKALRGTDWVLACLEAEGWVVRSMSGDRACPDLGRALRAGGNLDETVAGTTGPGCALTERRPCVVTGGEHFLEEAGGFICAAVPLFAPDGELAGVLNASRRHDGRALGVLEPLALAAREVENHMVANLAGDLRLAIHYRAELTDSPVRGLIHFDRDGCLLGANPVARQLLDLTRLEAEGRPVTLERLWGKVAPSLRRAAREPVALACRDGGQLYVRVESAARPVVALRRAPAGEAVADPLQARALKAYAGGVPVLINGETGTGKDRLARWLHRHGGARQGPFVAVNCASIPEGLIESELFGYEEGAFTGARRGGMAGKFEQADGGTLFLDEIGDMPLSLQARLLRVLQDREVTRLGGARVRPVSFSLVCATLQALDRAIAEGRFREDLFYRINGLRVALPALRERDDLEALMDALLQEVAPASPAPRLSPAARRALMAHSWPGNVRELQQALRLGAVLAEDGWIEPEHLPAVPRDGGDPPAPAPAPGTLEGQTRRAMLAALSASGGNVSAAARSLGIGRATFYRKMRRFGLERPGLQNR